jgi:uncharacterized protein
MSVIDSLEFARTEQTLRGSLRVPDLSRLHDGLYDLSGSVEFVLRGAHDSRRRPLLVVEVSGVLHLRCQRCLGLLDYPLRIANTLLLVTALEARSPELDDEELEWIEASPALDVAQLIEDEIILGLPYAPRHEEGRCTAGCAAPAAERAAGAFSLLAALKKELH